MIRTLPRNFRKALSIVLSFLVLTSYWAILPIQTNAALATQAQVQMSDSRPSHTGTTYTFTFVAGSTTANLKCILVQFAANADMTGGVPTTLDTTGAQFGSISDTGSHLTAGNLSLYLGHNGSTANGYLQFEDAGTEALNAGEYATASATTITNTSVSTFYAQITTYSAVSTHTCSSQVDQSNIIALQTVAGVSTTVTVNPTLTVNVADYGSAVNGSGDSSPVTTTSTTIPFGTVAAGATSWGSQTVTVSTNAANGYRLYVNDTSTMKDSNNDTLRDQSGTPGSPNSFDGTGTQSSFAYTGDGNGVVFGSNKWAGLGNSATQYLVAFRNAAVSSDATHLEYKVEVANTQPPGAYATTVVYTAVPSY